jgi:hypothetical protein
VGAHVPSTSRWLQALNAENVWEPLDMRDPQLSTFRMAPLPGVVLSARVRKLENYNLYQKKKNVEVLYSLIIYIYV